jgi:hypothetical protein
MCKSLRDALMNKSDRVLVVLLWILGVTALFAVVPVFMPTSWIAKTHRWLGLGELPVGPVVEYLARTLSAFYAMFGALCLLLATDLERYRPVAWFLGAAGLVMGVVFIGVDLVAGIPSWWTVGEGPSEVVIGAIMMVLARPRNAST